MAVIAAVEANIHVPIAGDLDGGDAFDGPDRAR
jgi:hypothetical protein